MAYAKRKPTELNNSTSLRKELNLEVEGLVFKPGEK